MTDVLAIILGGGQGSRLFPLTQTRSKPAVPIGGKYRLIDIPVSNCLHADLRRIFVLTQFNSASLNRHISQTYRLDGFSRGFVEILAAEQTPENANWFQGTADAVRRGMPHFIEIDARYYLILAGDHLYRMDFIQLLDAHVKAGADVTIATQPVSEADATSMGIFRFDRHGRIEDFEEKPTADRLTTLGRSVPADADSKTIPPLETPFVASMGIYVFSRDVLTELLEHQAAVDFGREIIPAAITRYNVHAYYHRDYWADVGTVRSFYDANIMLTQPNPPFTFYHPTRPIFSRPRSLPPARLDGCTMERAVVAEGSWLHRATLEDSLIGIRSRIGTGTRIHRSIIIGADFYEDLAQKPSSLPALGVGDDCVLDGVIVDKNARIGDGCVLTNERQAESADGPGYVIREGIIVVRKGAVVPSGTRI
jgi:glucose-1-phosphate adenylyltransferase